MTKKGDLEVIFNCDPDGRFIKVRNKLNEIQRLEGWQIVRKTCINRSDARSALRSIHQETQEVNRRQPEISSARGWPTQGPSRMAKKVTNDKRIIMKSVGG